MGRMKKMALVALLGLSGWALAAAPALLRDPRVATERQQFTPAQTRTLDALVRRIEAKPAAAQALEWRGGSLDRGAVWLSFTAPFRTRAPERLDVISLGQTENLTFLLVLTQGGREKVWHLQPREPNWANYFAPTAIYTTRDLKLDGRRELVIEYSGGIGDGGGGMASRALLLLDFTAQGPRVRGSLPLMSYTTDEEGVYQRQEAYVVKVVKGPSPRFLGERLNLVSEPYSEVLRSQATGQTVSLSLSSGPGFTLKKLW